MAKPPFDPGAHDSPRLVVPQAIVLILSTLIDELEDAPSATRVELRSIRSRLCRVYKLKDPQSLASETEVAQHMADADGLPIEDAP